MQAFRHFREKRQRVKGVVYCTNQDNLFLFAPADPAAPAHLPGPAPGSSTSFPGKLHPVVSVPHPAKNDRK